MEVPISLRLNGIASARASSVTVDGSFLGCLQVLLARNESRWRSCCPSVGGVELASKLKSYAIDIWSPWEKL